MVPISIWGIIFTLSLLLLVFGMLFKQPWARIFGSIFLMASGIVMLSAGGIQTGERLISTNPMTYEAIGVTASEPWFLGFGTGVILLGFLTIFWGTTKTKQLDPFFS